MTPRSQALAYRIWARAEPVGWDVSIRELAAELNASRQTILAVCRAKGWLTRLRKTTNDFERNPYWQGKDSRLRFDNYHSDLQAGDWQ